MKKSAKLYLKLFWSTFQLSAFVVGGGYVIVPLMQKMFVEKYGWISREDMLDITVLGQSAPGAIAINTAILIGFKLAGVLGSIVCVLGAILPPLVTVTIVAFFYSAFSSNVIVAGFLKGMQGGITAVILDVVYTMVKPYFKKRDIFSLLLMAGAFALTVFTNINVIFVVLGGIAIGIILYLLQRQPKLKAFIDSKIFLADEDNSQKKSLESILLNPTSEESGSSESAPQNNETGAEGERSSEPSNDAVGADGEHSNDLSNSETGADGDSEIGFKERINDGSKSQLKGGNCEDTDKNSKNNASSKEKGDARENGGKK